MSQGNPAGPEFAGPDFTPPSGPSSVASTPPTTSASNVSTWQSQFGKPVGSKRVALWGRIWPVVLVVVLVAVVVGAGVAIFNVNTWQRQSLVGTCTVLSGTNSDVTTTRADCAAPSFTWVIVKSVKSSAECSDEYASVYETFEDERGGSREFSAYCLMPNFVQGECYVELAESDVNGYSRTECSDAEADFRIAAVHDKALASLCQSDTEAWTFPDPARTFCLAEPQ